MKLNVTARRSGNSSRPYLWPIALLCLLCVSLSLWLILRSRAPKPEPKAGIAATKTQSLTSDPTRRAPPRPRVLTPAPSKSSSVRTLSSEKFRARFSARIERREVESVLRTLEAARRDVGRRTAAASLPPIEASALDVVIHDTTGDFVAATGQPWWAAAVTHDNLIELQPLEILRSRGVLDQTLRHEYAHTVIEILSHGRAPRWLAEGLAAYIAGEGATLTRGETQTSLSIEEIERGLREPSSAEEMRQLYAAAYREVCELIRSEGEASVWQRVAQNN